MLLFLTLVAWHSTGWLPATLQSDINEASQACLTLGIAALGMKTSFIELARSGRRTAALMLITGLWIGLLMLAGAWLLNNGHG